MTCRMRLVRKIVWLVASTAAVALAAAVVLASTRRPLPVSGIQYLFAVPIPFLAAGVLLLWRHPEKRAPGLLVYGTAGAMAYAAPLEQIIGIRYPETGPEPWMSWALFADALVMMLGLACLALLIGLFPEGAPATRGERAFSRSVRLLPLPMLIGLLANENILVEPITYGGIGPFGNPVYVPALSWLGPATESIRSVLGIAVVVALALLFVRYRRMAPDQRRQIRWVAFGSAAALAFGIVPFIISPLLDPDIFVHGQLLLSVGSLALALIPLSVVLAIEQPEWLDSDAFISKSFTYGALSLGIFVIYGGVAAGLGLAAGARLPLEVAIAVTAVLAFAFQPARTRLQQIADRWVFGDRPSPIEAVADFDRSMSTRDAGKDLNAHLAETIRKAARLRWASVDMPPEPSFTSGKRLGEVVHVVPIRRGDEQFGTVSCGANVNGSFKQSDADLVHALAGQAALVVSNARLAARIVHAQEAERRRLERNIHDGAQQELVALVAKLGLARARVKADGVDEATLIELQRDAGNILKDLRDLAQGIHPSVLTDGGLVEAVEDRCSRLPIDVVIEASPGLRSRRFRDDVEGAAYFFVTEGLTNVLKHAEATEARVGLRRDNGSLMLSIADNGRGFDPASTGWNGLAGLMDRFSALAGSVEVKAGEGAGTVIEGTIPVAESS